MLEPRVLSAYILYHVVFFIFSDEWMSNVATPRDWNLQCFTEVVKFPCFVCLFHTLL